MHLATYNIQHGTRIAELTKTFQTLAASGCELFCVQEVHDTHAGRRTEEFLLEALGKHWQYEVFCGNGYELGLALFWNEHVLHPRRFFRWHVPRLSKLSSMDRFWFPGVVQRGALAGEFESAEGLVRATTVHLDWQGGWAWRQEQLHALRRYLEENPVALDIVCGDLNTYGPRYISLRQEAGILTILDSTFRNISAEVEWTSDLSSIHPEDGRYRMRSFLRKCGLSFPQKLDHVFAKGWQSWEAKMEDLSGSDHRPIVVTLSHPI